MNSNEATKRHHKFSTLCLVFIVHKGTDKTKNSGSRYYDCTSGWNIKYNNFDFLKLSLKS